MTVLSLKKAAIAARAAHRRMSVYLRSRNGWFFDAHPNQEGNMRGLIFAAIGFTAFATVARADGPPISNQLPQNMKDQQVYIFMLKANNVSLHMSPHDFCSNLGYGDAAPDFWDQGPEQVVKDAKDAKGEKKTIPGELAWVICQFPAKQK